MYSLLLFKQLIVFIILIKQCFQMNKFYVWGGDVTDDRYQMSHSAKIMSDIFYMHAFVRHFGSKCNPRHET